ncbi:PQQ-dependent sugar dehydrogenase [Deinococcus cellulosilyticus]|uniref:Glucose dehydrogenase n=1 Tax=Deinococcus cellulosilyticus (strain DSM 18568 / NBRC 106333 / KACC 11606 / 5516J-15) TaxID=1223518 RepID=A0A511N0Y6_DEIC1|nr:PQQ-dependent sugar dehydrogenase [Deinococcus cellulosilyticus]GEM46524.1 glucose dehydrogenase [Deinococcus cellulosilyticus NBRC 106333 = KACC 11606]
MGRNSLVLGMVLLASCSFAASNLKLQKVIDGLNNPLGITSAMDGSNRLFVVQQVGLIRIVKNGKLVSEPFLDIRSLTRAGGEQGLLGLAFAPDYEKSGFFFVNYTDRNGNTQVVRYKVSKNPDVADAKSAQKVISVDQPYANHNGGHLAFGKDGYLYIGLGDGGSGGDPQNHGQNLNSLLGKMLRLDVSALPYKIPKDNPFVGKDGKDEIWAYGLRNPWRYSFDRQTGDLWIADVGQNALEEVNVQKASSKGGENYGWRLMEGTRCYNPSDNCDRGNLVKPVHEYPRSEGVSITGGVVYRGKAIADLKGTYLFGDFGTGKLWGLTLNGSKASNKLLLDTGMQISSFGEDEAGEVYITDYSGTLYKLTD